MAAGKSHTLFQDSKKKNLALFDSERVDEIRNPPAQVIAGLRKALPAPERVRLERGILDRPMLDAFGMGPARAVSGRRVADGDDRVEADLLELGRRLRAGLSDVETEIGHDGDGIGMNAASRSRSGGDDVDPLIVIEPRERL